MAGGGPSRTLGHGGGLSPYHVGVRGGHDVGVGAVGAHGVPQRGEPCRGVGGRGGQVLVVGAFWRWCFFFFFLEWEPCMGLPGGCGRCGDSPVGPQSSSECRSRGRRLAASVLGGRLGCRGSPEHQEGLQLLLSLGQRHTAPGTPWGHDGVWIWSLSPPGPTTGTSPTYPAEGAARLRSTGRAAWLLGSPRAAGRGRDVWFCLDPGSLLLRLCPRGGGMPDDNPRANMGGGSLPYSLSASPFQITR